MNIKDTIWLIGVVVALGVTWGMTSQKVWAMEKNIDRLEKSLQLLIKIETRIDSSCPTINHIIQLNF